MQVGSQQSKVFSLGDTLHRRLLRAGQVYASGWKKGNMWIGREEGGDITAIVFPSFLFDIKIGALGL